MAANVVPFSHLSKLAYSGGLNWTADTINAALVTSAYTINLANTIWANVSPNELAAGGGYVAGGVALTGKTIDNDKASAATIAFPTLTNKQFRYVVLYKAGSGGGLTNPLIGIMDYGDTHAVNGVAFEVRTTSAGILAFSTSTG